MSTSPGATAILQGACGWCGSYHVGVCPRVKRMTYHGDGTLASVEFHDSRPWGCTCFEAGRNPACVVHGSSAGGETTSE